MSLVPVSNWPRLILSIGPGAGRRRGPRLGAVAQLGERLICIQEVAGSIPTSSTRWERFVFLARGAWRAAPLERACSSGG